MKRFFLSVLLVSALCLPSNGQIREILDNGEVLEYYSGMVFETLGESMYSYRFIYGRYPEDKQALLDFHLEKAKVEEHVLFRGLLLDFENGSVEFEEDDDSDYTALLAKRDSLITVDLNDPENVLTVSGDTCTFTYAKATRELFYYGFDESVSDFKLRAIQCIGGPEDLQKKDYLPFRQHIRTLVYDKDGKCLLPLCSDAPYAPQEVEWKFNFVVSRDPAEYHEGGGVYSLARPVLIPFTITRSGVLSYDVSCLDGMQLYYRNNVRSTGDSIDAIKIEDAIDPEYLDALKTYTKVIFDEHEEVDRVKLWELVWFNNLPKGYVSFYDHITGLGVYESDRVDSLPLCNGVPFTEGFLPEFKRRFHPEKSDDNPDSFEVLFVIDKDGKLVGPRMWVGKRFINGATTDELSAYEKQVFETVNQIQDWEPGKVDGNPVNVFLTVPVIF
jgi:hypothetical protein